MFQLRRLALRAAAALMLAAAPLTPRRRRTASSRVAESWDIADEWRPRADRRHFEIVAPVLRLAAYLWTST